jgi:CTP:phosphocholine cytidylyltransferase-like protein
LDLFTGLVFLGTPHPIYRKDTPTDQLDSIVNASKMRSKEMLAAIREEVAFVWNVSLKFEEVTFEYQVISAYETKVTKIPIGFFRSKREIVGIPWHTDYQSENIANIMYYYTDC